MFSNIRLHVCDLNKNPLRISLWRAEVLGLYYSIWDLYGKIKGQYFKCTRPMDVCKNYVAKIVP